MKAEIQKTIKNLKENNIYAVYVESKEDILPILKELIKDGDTVGVGGSESLTETGVLDFLRGGKFNFLDRYRKGLSQEEVEQILRDSLQADVYLCSSNAVTENGELYNVDGRSNRVAAIAYGTKSVIMVVGINKIVPNLDEAIVRVKSVAAPKNAVRVGSPTPCAKTGKCISLSEKQNKGYEMTAGCQTDARICCNYLVSARQRQKDRIKVILVGETLGY